MAHSFELQATARADVGRGASRRLRRAKQVPAILYSKNTPAQPLTLDHQKVLVALANEAFYSHILTLHIDGVPQQAVLKDLHRHPYKPTILHMDFLRVSAHEKITMHVPLHFLNEADAPGIVEGGVINKHMNEVEVRCLPKDLPEYFEVNCGGLNIDDVIHLSELTVPKGVELMALAHGDSSHDHTLVSVHRPHVVKEEEESTAPAASEVPASEQKTDAASDAAS
jgi:large subunit ribosomal protein L25